MRNKLFTIDNLKLAANIKGIFSTNHKNLTDIYQKHYFSFDDLIQQTKIKEDKSITIVDLGCGNGDAILATLNLLKARLPHVKIRYVAVDILEDKIKQCQEQFASLQTQLQEQNIELEFHQLDASKVESFAKILEKRTVDFMIVRHPVIAHTFATKLDEGSTKLVTSFKKMLFSTIPFLLRKGGMIFSSFYYSAESREFERLMNLSLSRDAKKSLMNTLEQSTGAILMARVKTETEGHSDQLTCIVKNYQAIPDEKLVQILQKECPSSTSSYACKAVFFGAASIVGYLCVNYVALTTGFVPEERKEEWDNLFNTSFFKNF